MLQASSRGECLVHDTQKLFPGHAKIVVVLHPEEVENAAAQKVAAITGIQSLGGGAKVTVQ